MQSIQVTCSGKTLAIEQGTTVREALVRFGLGPELSGDYQKNPYVSAVVNNVHVSLSAPLSYTCAITPVRLFSSLGKRCYRQSLCFLVAAAALRLWPERHLVIGYALGDGYYFTFDDQLAVTAETARELSQTMRDIQESDQEIVYDRISHQDATQWFSAHRFLQTRDLLETTNTPAVEVYRMGSFLDLAYDPVVPSSGLVSVWEVRQYQLNGLLVRYPRSFDFTKLDTYRDNPLLFEALKLDKRQRPILRVESISDLSRISQSDQLASYIRLCEAYQAKHIGDIADRIIAKTTARFAFICGPSSSGKTTFAYKLCDQLQVRGRKTIELSLDNYYLHPSRCPKDADGNPDFEVIDALDLPLLEENLADLAAGKPVRLPVFDFATKERSFTEPQTMDAHTIMVIEGIHGMNPRLIGHLDEDLAFRIYISAFTQVNITDHNRISTTDNRIIRRIVRDHRTRASSALQTLKMMPNVQRGENLYIFPYQNNADVMINSALDYELAVLAPLAQPLLRAVPPTAGEYYVTARRLLGFLDNFQPISERMVPKTSMLREFIGGSEYQVS